MHFIKESGGHGYRCKYHNCLGDSCDGHNLNHVFQYAYLQPLEEDYMIEIMQKTRHINYKKEKSIGPGEESDTLYIVNRGRLKLYRISESGKEQVIGF